MHDSLFGSEQYSVSSTRTLHSHNNRHTLIPAFDTPKTAAGLEHPFEMCGTRRVSSREDVEKHRRWRANREDVGYLPTCASPAFFER